MKKFLVLFISLVVSINLMALGDNDSVKSVVNEYYSFSMYNDIEQKELHSVNMITESGRCIKQSGNYQIYSLISALGSVSFFYLSTRDDITKQAKDVFYGGGIACGFASAICGIISINYKIQGGKSLELSANHITYRF